MVSNDLRENIIQSTSLAKTSLKKLQEATFNLFDISQRSKQNKLPIILKNMNKVKIAVKYLSQMDFAIFHDKKANENNELIKIYSETLLSLSKLEKCLQASVVKDGSINMHVIKKNLDNLRMAHNSLKYFDPNMGFDSKDWQKLERSGELDNG